MVTGGGGIHPDYLVGPAPLNRLRIALDASGSITSFATDYLQRNKVDADFEATPAILDEFEAFASARGIQPSIGQWAAESVFLRSRIKTEIFNQAFGVERGDQVELQRDPLILKALELLGG